MIPFQEWLTVVEEHASPDVIVMILGNKADMSSERVVKREQGERLAKVWLKFFVTIITV